MQSPPVDLSEHPHSIHYSIEVALTIDMGFDKNMVRGAMRDSGGIGEVGWKDFHFFFLQKRTGEPDPDVY